MPRQSVAILLGLIYGLGITLQETVTSGEFDSTLSQLVSGAVIGSLVGAAIGIVGMHEGPLLAARRFPSPDDLVAGIAAGAACAVGASLGASLERSAWVGLTALVGFAFAVGLTRPAEVPGADMSPSESYRSDLLGALAFGLIGGSALAAGVASGVHENSAWLEVGTIIVIGAVVGLAGAVCASQAIALLVVGLWLRLTGRGPFLIMRFLEHARDRKLLRCAGTQYQFRHQELQLFLSPLAVTTTLPEHERALTPGSGGGAQEASQKGSASP